MGVKKKKTEGEAGGWAEGRERLNTRPKKKRQEEEAKDEITAQNAEMKTRREKDEEKVCTKMKKEGKGGSVFDGGSLVAEEDAHEELFSDFKVTTFLEHAAIRVESLDKVGVHFKDLKITIFSSIKLLKLLEESSVVKVRHRICRIDFSGSLEVGIGPDEEGTVAELLGVSEVAVFFLQGC